MSARSSERNSERRRGDPVSLEVAGPRCDRCEGAHRSCTRAGAPWGHGAYQGIRSEHLGFATRMGVVSSLRHHKHLFSDLDNAVAHSRSEREAVEVPSGPDPPACRETTVRSPADCSRYRARIAWSVQYEHRRSLMIVLSTSLTSWQRTPRGLMKSYFLLWN